MFPGSTNALVMFDRATGWTECAPQGALSHVETVKAMRFFQGTSGRKVKAFYADNWPAITSAAVEMGWANPHSTPGVPQSNGLAERMIRRVKEGGRSNLIQSGLPYVWWPWAATHHCAARNIQEVDGDSPYNKRHNSGKCQAIEIPLGALILYAPTPTAGKSPGFAPKNRYGLFLGYDFHPGGLFAGMYRVLKWESVRSNPRLMPSSATIQSVDSIFPSTKKDWYFS